MKLLASILFWLQLVLVARAIAEDPPDKFYATGLVTISPEDANQVVILVPDWEVLITLLAFKKDLASELAEENYQEIFVEKGEKSEQLRALEGKVAAVEGVVGDGGEEENPHMKVVHFVEAQHEAAKALLTVKK
jgi:hypothetical protein